MIPAEEYKPLRTHFTYKDHLEVFSEYGYPISELHRFYIRKKSKKCSFIVIIKVEDNTLG